MKTFSFIFCLPSLMLLVLAFVSDVTLQCNFEPTDGCVKGMQPINGQRFAVAKVLSTDILCDTVTESGGWYVFQRRQYQPDVFTPFNQSWKAYKLGFGDICTDYWWGLDKIYNVTNTPHQRYQLRIYLTAGRKTFEGIYDDFKLDTEVNRYMLSIGNFKGNLTNDLALHNGAKFATPDMDNDVKCACFFKVGWWFKECFNVNLKGKLGTLNPSTAAVWDGLTNQNLTITYVEMSYRPIDK